MKKAWVILNPSSGNEKAKEYKELITKTLKKDYDDVQIKETKKFGDATKFALAACEDQVDLLVSMGGDGTVNEVINGLAIYDQRPPYGIIPLGTVNDLAQALNIPQNVEEAIKMLTKGKIITIDIGRINQNYFGNMVTVGKVPEAIHDVSIEEKTRLGALAYYVEGAKRILENETFHARISFNDYVWEGEIAALIIGLTRALGAFNRIFPNAEVDDGVLHFIAMKDLSFA